MSHYQTVQQGEVLTGEQLRMPVEELVRVGKLPLSIFPDTGTLYTWLAREMANEIIDANRENRPLRWVLPVGPKHHYRLLAEITNAEHISWKNVWCFHMDEWCNWEGRCVPVDHPYSLRGYMQRELYDRIDPELRNPVAQVIYPDPAHIEEYSERIQEVGGIDTTFAGFGFRGHVAFNDTPVTRWTNVSIEQLRQGKTRIVQLSDDTMIAHSHRSAGGNTFAIPPMAITIGMADILASRKLMLITDGGAWKQFIIRILLLGKPDVRFPVTLCQDHPRCTVTCDAASVAPIFAGV